MDWVGKKFVWVCVWWLIMRPIELLGRFFGLRMQMQFRAKNARPVDSWNLEWASNGDALHSNQSLDSLYWLTIFRALSHELTIYAARLHRAWARGEIEMYVQSLRHRALGLQNMSEFRTIFAIIFAIDFASKYLIENHSTRLFFPLASFFCMKVRVQDWLKFDKLCKRLLLL